MGKWFDARFTAYSQVLCEEVSPGELEMASLRALLSTDERTDRRNDLTSHSCFLESVSDQSINFETRVGEHRTHGSVGVS